MVKDILPINNSCLAHNKLPEAIKVIPYPADLTIEQAIRIAQEKDLEINELVLPFDLVTEFICENCHTNERVMRSKERVNNAQAICPRCRQLRNPIILTSIASKSSHANVKLRELGIPNREILTFSHAKRRTFLQVGE
jgi:thiamine pyrophosphate-dependent acetolactate synthase large subunit-like protein